MKCTCGAIIPEGASFFAACGRAVPKTLADLQPVSYGQDLTDAQNNGFPGGPGHLDPAAVTLGEDGKYRWFYSVNLYKNPTFLWLVWKIFFFIILGIFCIFTIVDLIDWGGFDAERFLNTFRIMGYFLLGMTVLVVLSYLIYARIMGGRYIAVFEMDGKGLLHKQITVQAKKAKGIGSAAILAGALSGSISTAAAGMSARRTEMYSDYKKVRKIRAYPRRNLIKINNKLQHNRAYVPGESFLFVADYLKQHCPQARK